MTVAVQSMVSEQLGLYSRQAGELKQDAAQSRFWAHSRRSESEVDEAQTALSLLIHFGLSVLTTIRQWDEAWSHSVQARQIVLTEQDVRALGSWYRDWLNSSKPLLEQLSVIHSIGRSIPGRDEFEKACAEVQGLLNIPVERVAQAAEQAPRSNRRTTGDIRRELRNVLG